VSATASRALLVRRSVVTAAKARRRRTVLLCLIAGAAAVAGAWWVVTGPPGRISSVSVTGYEGPDSAKVNEIIRRVAKRGSVVDPPVETLRRSVAGFPWVDDLHLQRRLPKGVSVVVVPSVPGAVAVPESGAAMMVSSTGRVLGPLPKGGAPDVPRVRVGAVQLTPGGTIKGGVVTATLALSARLTPKVAGRLVGLREQRGSLVGQLSEGPEVRFGLMQDMSAKAEALNLVLGQISPAEERQAVYIDVSVPWFPAVGDGESEPVAEPAPPPAPSVAEPSSTP
jgi:Cell division protein FtsQ